MPITAGLIVPPATMVWRTNSISGSQYDRPINTTGKSCSLPVWNRIAIVAAASHRLIFQVHDSTSGKDIGRE